MNDDKGLSGEVGGGDGRLHAQNFKAQKLACQAGFSDLPRPANGINSYRNPTPTSPFGESRHCALERARSTTPLIAQLDVMKAASAAVGVQSFPIPPWHLPDPTIMQTSNTTQKETPTRQHTLKDRSQHRLSRYDVEQDLG